MLLVAALSLAVTLAVAAPSALPHTRSVAAAEYCSPGHLDARQAAVNCAEARLKVRAKAKNAGARAKLVWPRTRPPAFRKQLQRAEAKLARCD